MIGTIGKAAGVNGVAIAAPDARGERGAPARPPHHAGVPDQPVGVEGQLARLRFVGDETAIRIDDRRAVRVEPGRSEEHTSELQSPMRISYAVFCLKKKNTTEQYKQPEHTR